VISLEPVAYFHSSFKDKADLPRQAVLSAHCTGIIRFLPGRQFEQALDDIEGMERLWVIFWMHKVCKWKAKVQPPRDVSKKGVFSTRSPHRPNPIGLSCVKLIDRHGLDLIIEGHDLLDGSPVLDIKPYLAYADSFPQSRSGWIEEVSPIPSHEIQVSDLADNQLNYLKDHGLDIRFNIETRLKSFIAPSSYNRITEIEKGVYLLAYKTWRVLFTKETGCLLIVQILSGYDKDTLEGRKESVWPDVSLHRIFCQLFPCQGMD
jgi:tRNA (adenine37-N6)-methyltransferase